MSDDDITFKVTGELAKQVKEMKEELGLNSESEVMKWGLSLLYYSIGKEVKIEDKDKKRTMVFDQFKK